MAEDPLSFLVRKQNLKLFKTQAVMLEKKFTFWKVLLFFLNFTNVFNLVILSSEIYINELIL